MPTPITWETVKARAFVPRHWLGRVDGVAVFSADQRAKLGTSRHDKRRSVLLFASKEGRHVELGRFDNLAAAKRAAAASLQPSR